MSRSDLTQRILAEKIRKGLSWDAIARTLGVSKEWAAAACLGQMALTAAQAHALCGLLNLPREAETLLQIVPYKGSLPTGIPTDPLLYRFYEILSVYGMAIKEIIHEEFGDGIMSAIDFRMRIAREPDPQGDRVKIEMSGKFLPYRVY
ncbi:cyanate lyase [Methylacidimicrobium cyclopophantes]|uniref:Cyanate hydratase n=1 Tax=Methylacidimicrobium cyclopophantes TaxID=1041766 RepID=A0A5E6MAJ7_9BACT|nr:cyanase [Methylacidimicrobium cyclopophantes]VVM06425.1 cyanate lyase [Methylacidimicrobium cyclopophantes]